MYLYRGVVTSAHADAIVVTFSTGTGLIGSGCAEYTTTTLDQTGQSATTVTFTTTQAIEDLIEFSSSSGGGQTCGSGWNSRAAIQFSGTTYALMCDKGVTSTGSQSSSFSGSIAGVEMDSTYGVVSTGTKSAPPAMVR
jgi:hypothetical protein